VDISYVEIDRILFILKKKGFGKYLSLEKTSVKWACCGDCSDLNLLEAMFVHGNGSRLTWTMGSQTKWKFDFRNSEITLIPFNNSSRTFRRDQDLAA